MFASVEESSVFESFRGRVGVFASVEERDCVYSRVFEGERERVCLSLLR